MNKAKTAEFPSDLARLAELCRAISHPARLSILQTLAERGECICGEIVDVVPLAQSTVSQHLKQLRDVGLIQGEIDGPRSCYCLNKKTVQELTRAFEKIVKTGCCC